MVCVGCRGVVVVYGWGQWVDLRWGDVGWCSAGQFGSIKHSS